jgi:hypothetical protein
LSHDDNENASVINTQPKKDYLNTPTVLVTGALTGIGRTMADDLETCHDQALSLALECYWGDYSL